MRHLYRSKILLVLSSLATLAVACSDGSNDDAGTPASTDANDAGDAGMTDPVDSGVEDVGACGCTFGYHHSCSANEVCVSGQTGEPMCIATQPSNGCVATSTAGIAAPCDAQCVEARAGATPCSGMNVSGIQATIRDWFSAIENARSTFQPTGWERMTSADIENAQTSVTLTVECIDFLGWTMFALMEFCRGPNTVRHFEPWDSVENLAFKYLESPADDCRIAAGAGCESAFRGGVQGGGGAAVDLIFDNIEAACPGGLPFSAPCDGANAKECAKARVRGIIQAF